MTGHGTAVLSRGLRIQFRITQIARIVSICGVVVSSLYLIWLVLFKFQLAANTAYGFEVFFAFVPIIVTVGLLLLTWVNLLRLRKKADKELRR